MAVELLLDLVQRYDWLVIFLGSFFFGDTVILSLAILSFSGYFSPFTLVVFVLLGTLLSDSLWFWGGRLGVEKVGVLRRAKLRHKELLASIEDVVGERPFWFLLVAKCLYGTRIIFIMYLALRRLSFATFVLFDLIGTLLWLGVLVLVGWLVVQGLTAALSTFSQIQVLLTSIVIVIVAFRVFSVWFQKRVTSH